MIVLEPGSEADNDGIFAHCRTRIAGYKCPRSIAFRDAFPLSSVGKAPKTKPRKPYWESHVRGIA